MNRSRAQWWKLLLLRLPNFYSKSGEYNLRSFGPAALRCYCSSCWSTPLLVRITGSFEGQPLTQKSIAYLETHNFFYFRITDREYLNLFKIKHPTFDVTGWNQLFDLPLDRYVEQYSTGMKKKLAFMGIVALDRPILILDEPFNGIDLETTQKLKIIIKALRERDKTILLTSYILESLTSLCDDISYLNNKQIQYTFDRTEFAKMEETIFQHFNVEHEAVVRKLMEG